MPIISALVFFTHSHISTYMPMPPTSKQPQYLPQLHPIQPPNGKPLNSIELPQGVGGLHKSHRLPGSPCGNPGDAQTHGPATHSVIPQGEGLFQFQDQSLLTYKALPAQCQLLKSCCKQFQKAKENG